MRRMALRNLAVIFTVQIFLACLWHGVAFAAKTVTLSPTSVTMNFCSAGTSYNNGDTVSVKVVPNCGYSLKSVTSTSTNNNPPAGGYTDCTSNYYSFTMGTSAVTVSNTVTDLTTGTYTVTVTQGAHGTIAPVASSSLKASCSGVDYWASGSTAQYTITPDAGYVLDHYKVDSKPTTIATTAYDNSTPLTVSITIGSINHTLSADATSFQNTRTVTVAPPTGAVTGTVTSCGTTGDVFPASGTASYSIQPTVAAAGASLIDSITVTPTSPQTGSSVTYSVSNGGITNGGTGYTCSSPFTFPMNKLNETMTVNYTGSDAVVKTVNTNGAASSTGGSIAVCGNYGTDNWPPSATASYSIKPNSGYVLSSLTLSPSTPTTNPAGYVHGAGYDCGNYTFPINAQTQSLTANFVDAVPVTGAIQVNGSTSNVTLNCNNSTGVCTATDAGGSTIGTLTSCNGSNSWGQNQGATYTVIPGNGYKLVSIAGGGTSNSGPPAGGYTSCSNGYVFNAGTGTTLTGNFVLSSSAAINGQVVNSAGVSSGGDLLVGTTSLPTAGPYFAAQNSPVTVSFAIPSGAGIKNLYWTPSGGSLVDVTAMLSCASLSPADFTSNTCQFTIPATTGTTPGGVSFTGVGTAGGTVKVVYDKAYTFTVSATTSGCGGSNGGLVNGAATRSYKVVNGSTVTATGTAAAGYAIKDVTYNGTSIGVAASQLGTSYSYPFGPITSDTNAGAFLFTPVFTVNSNAPVATPATSTATGTLTPASQQVMCGSAILPITIAPTPPASVQGVTMASPDGTTVNLGAVTVLDGSISNLGSVQKSWTVTATFYQDPINTSNYSIIPPFVQSAVLPNLLLMIDNSSSQYDLQYDSTGQCYDNNAYLNTTTYAGYFANASFYSYNATSHRFESGATLPDSCTYRTPYFCVAMSGTKPNRTVSNFVASGNFLNYLAMSKLDIQKLILTGGKYDVGNGNLIAESRGCNGKRFVKVISNTQDPQHTSTEDLSNVTFVIRGPNASSGANFNPAVQGGTTNIDIYDYSYANQIATCQKAFGDWASGASQGTTQNDTDACISSSATVPKYNNMLQLVHSCYYTIEKGNSAPPAGQVNNVESGCQTEYQGNPPVSPSSITNNQAGDAVCSSVISHAPMNGSDVGYVGVCWNGTGFDDSCVVNQINNFCGIMQQNQVTDPSTTTITTTTTSYAAAMPGFFMDAGINSLGNAAASYLAVAAAPAPTGLIDQFNGYINFGAMTFNQDGAGSECIDVTGSTTIGQNQIACARHCSNNPAKACYFDGDCGTGNSCVTSTKLDGGQLVSNITSNASIGDHSSGLINKIDNITAGSWTPWGEAFYDAIGYFANNTGMRLQTQDWDNTQPPPMESCRLNNILMITDGMATADRNAAVGSLAQQYNDGSTSSYGTCSYYSGSKNVAAMSWIGNHRNIHDLTQAANKNVNNQYITTYVAYSGPQAQSTTDPCDPYNLMTRTAADSGTTLYYATTYSTMFQNLEAVFKTVATSSASGTAASILNNSQGSGANLLQAVFFPRKVFNYTTNNVQYQDVANWIGELQNLWFYVDPYLGNSSVREDTPTQDFTLSMTHDNVVSFGYTQNQATVTLAQDVNGDGSNLVTQRSTTLDGLNSLWKAGQSLWKRNVTSGNDPRQIYTLIGTPDSNGVVTGTLTKFSSADADNFNSNATAQGYLQVTGADAAAKKANANTLIDYISGIDQDLYRPRRVTIPGCGLTDGEGCKREWKLGDIVNSTPKLVSTLPLNAYAAAPPTGYGDRSYTDFTRSQNYLNRGMTFVGGNDGMLHAFRLGILNVDPVKTASGAVDADKKARMMWPDNGHVATSGSDLGREEWAFIPMNALPYLKYLGDPNYTHLYYVDDTVILADMSIAKPANNDAANYGECATDYSKCQKKTTLDGSGNLDMNNTSWRTILIGGMGLGGATAAIGSGCSANVASGSCVKLPMTGSVGYSSFFALDVTNPHSLPDSGSAGAVKLLWEFNGKGKLGYSLSSPAIVRIGPKDQNGRWFAVFGSGPTGPIESTSHTFYGKSNQHLLLFVVDVATGALVTTIDTGLDQAFAGAMSTGVIDIDRNYSDDAVYIGYTQADNPSSPTAWNKGGVLRLLTLEDPDPSHWKVTPLISGIAPVTSSIAKLQDINVRYGGSTGKLWLYFGSGRYFYKTDTLSPTDPFQIYGVSDPCYSMHSSGGTPTGPTNRFPTDPDNLCTATVAPGDLVNQTGSATQPPSATIDALAPGWTVKLASSESVGETSFNAERVITNPNANANGTVFFSTLMPSTDVCGVGGNTYIWAFKYDTGATPLINTMKGSILLQVSTGDLQQVNLADAFNNPGNKGYNLRRLSAPISGVPPTGSGMVGMNRPQPAKKMLHIQEK